MSEPFLAEVRMFGFSFPPRGWSFCDGQILPISQNQSLYSLIGTTYGGDGVSSFALPDLRGRTPIHQSSDHRLGQKGGTEGVTLDTAQIPEHRHSAKASSLSGNSSTAHNHLLAAESAPDAAYSATVTAGTTSLGPHSISNVGGNQSHNNMQPYLTVQFCIALSGLFPSRN